MSDYSDNPHSHRHVTDGLSGYRAPETRRWHGHGVKASREALRASHPTVTGCRYDDILWRLEWLCEEALVLGDDFAEVLPLLPERVELPVDDQIVLASVAKQGVRPLLDLAFEMLGDKPDSVANSPIPIYALSA